MALSDEKKNLLLGATIGDTVQNADDNFTSLFDSIDELNDKIPTQTSQLTNNSGYITKDVNNLTNYTVKGETGTDIELTVDANYVMTLNLKNSAGTVVSTANVDLPIESLVMGATYEDGTLTLTLQNGTTIDVDISALISGLVPDSRKVNGKALSSDVTLTQDDVGDGTTYKRYSATEKTKLAGIAEGANKYTHPSYTARTSALYKITVDASGHVSAVTAVTKSDITGLGIPAQDTTYSNATTSKAGLMSATDKTKLDAIDESLEGVTADEIGKVKDVTVNGTSVLGTDGTATIVIDDLTSEYTSFTASTSMTINGTTYYGISIFQTETAFEIYNASGYEVVTQKVLGQSNRMFIACGTTSGETFTLRKLSGGAVGRALYRHNILLYHNGVVTLKVSLDIINSDSAKITTWADFIDITNGKKYTASGIMKNSTGTLYNVHYMSGIGTTLNPTSAYAMGYSADGTENMVAVGTTDSVTVIDTVTEIQ